MNIRNEMDEALDTALEEHLKELFVVFFAAGDAGELKVNKLLSDLRSVEAAYTVASKALDKL